MIGLIDAIRERQEYPGKPFMLYKGQELSFNDVLNAESVGLDSVKPGDVVGLVGDFDPLSIKTLLHLFDRRAVVVPLSPETEAQHEYFCQAAKIQYIVTGENVKVLSRPQIEHPLLEGLRSEDAAGLVLFSSGTTGRPKAILHDFRNFQKRFHTPRPALRTLNFLLFDHIGGLNTLFHTLFNNGMVIVPEERSPASVVSDIVLNKIELLPTTPTFLRMVLISGLLETEDLSSLRIITYGTERMDQPTLDRLCRALPNVDFRQTFGMSELGILRVKSKGRDSLWMKVGGEGVTLRCDERNVLHIKTETPMLGYMNAPNPFDEDGWYNTRDIVETDGDFIKVVARDSDVINVGGLKILPSEVERIALMHPKVAFAKAYGRENPLTGQHIECIVQQIENSDLNKPEIRAHFSENLPVQLRPRKIKLDNIGVNHRFKKSS